jgi:peptidoglycan/LPS O-acetylase OafA/YrhL
MLRKITGPGIFRLFLALMVFVHHTTRLAIGSSCVYIFFCLSGFWIYTMYTGRYAATRQPYFTYAVSRMWRLLPTFWLVTVITLLFLAQNGTLAASWRASSPLHFVLANSLIFGYSSLSIQPIVPAWSLDMEMQFYVIAPLLVIFFSRRKAATLWILFAISAASLASFLLNNPLRLVDNLVYFSVGMAAASANWRPSGKLALSSLAATTLLLAGVILTRWSGILLVGSHPGPLASYTGYANAAIAFSMMPYAIFTTGQKGFAADGLFADLSYIVYLLHWVGAIWLGAHLGGTLHRLACMALTWTIVIGLSYAIWKLYDHPINRMRSRWVGKRKRPAAVPPRAADPVTIKVMA